MYLVWPSSVATWTTNLRVSSLGRVLMGLFLSLCFQMMSWIVPTFSYCYSAQQFCLVKKSLNQTRPSSSFALKLLLASAHSLYSELKSNLNNYYLFCSPPPFNAKGCPGIWGCIVFLPYLFPIISCTLSVFGGYEVAPVSWLLIHPGAWQDGLNGSIHSRVLVLVKQSLELFFRTTKWSLCWPECRLSWSVTREGRCRLEI